MFINRLITIYSQTCI